MLAADCFAAAAWCELARRRLCASSFSVWASDAGADGAVAVRGFPLSYVRRVAWLSALLVYFVRVVAVREAAGFTLRSGEVAQAARNWTLSTYRAFAKVALAASTRGEAMTLRELYAQLGEVTGPAPWSRAGLSLARRALHALSLEHAGCSGESGWVLPLSEAEAREVFPASGVAAALDENEAAAWCEATTWLAVHVFARRADGRPAVSVLGGVW